MGQRRKGWLVLLGCVLLLTASIQAQPYVAAEEMTSGNGNWLGITIRGNPSLRFSSVDDYASGVTLDHATLELNVGPTLQWTLQVRATSDLQNGVQSIPVSVLSIQPLNTPGGSATITLSTTNQTLLTGQLTRLQLIAPTFRYRAQGTKHLLKPGGTYSTTLVFAYTAL